MTDKIRVLLADDHAVLRAGLRALIGAETDLVVVGEAADGVEAVEKIAELKPDVVVMDIAMPRMSGLDAIRAVRSRNLDTKILVLTMHAEEQYLLQVLRAGGSGYVLKRSADTELMEAIRTVHSGQAFLDPSAQKRLLQEYLGQVGDDDRDRYNALSEREREVLQLTAAGYTNQEIADRLIISVKTVDTYRSRIMEKLGLRHRSELVKFALAHGLLDSQV